VVAPTESEALHERQWKMNDRNTDLTVALDRDIALLGRYEPLVGNSVVSAVEVAAINTRTFWNNKHMVYSGRPDFLMLDPQVQPARASSLLKLGLL
jgi:hypothetical protein